jgi:putative ABC transport system permease protein
VGGIATGVALIVAINVINSSILESFQRTIEVMAGPAALEITLGVGEVGFPEATVETVRADPDVAAAVPLVRGTIAPASEPSHALQLFGVDLTQEEELRRYRVRMTSARREASEALVDPHSVFLTVGFAQSRHWRVGDAISLTTARGVEAFTLRGLLEPEGLATVFGGQIAVMDLTAAQRALAKEGRVDQIDVVVRDGGDVAAVRDRLRAALPPSLSVARPLQRGAQYDQVLGSFQAMLTGLSLLCLVAGVYIVYNTTSTGAGHRAFAMAGLRLTGASSEQLFRLLMLEAVLLGMLGVLVGIPLGILLARLLTGMVASSMSVIFQLRFPVDRLAVDATEMAAIGGAGTAAAAFASYFAARRVARMEPLDVMRVDLRSMVTRSPSRRFVGWWAVLVLVSVFALGMEIERKSIAWGNFGSTLWFASSIVIAVPLITALAAVLSRILPAFFGAEGRVAAESLFRSPTRTGVTVAAIALVLTVALTSASLARSLSRSIGSYFSGGFLACDLAVSAVTTDGGWLETPLPEEVGSELAQLPGVRSADLIRILPGHLYRGVRIAIGGGSDGIFDPGRYPPGWYRAGDPVRAAPALQAGKGANISLSLAERFGLRVGDDLALAAPTGTVRLTVVGIVPDYMSDRGSVILSRKLLVDRWRDHAVNRVHLFLEPGVSAATVRERIIARLGSRYRLKILTPREVIQFHTAQVDRAFRLMDAIQLLIVFVTVAGILDLLLSAILERKRELSLWRVIGADEAAVRRSVVIESATIGTIGAALGVGLGFATAWIWVAVNFRYLLGYYLDYHFAADAAGWFVVLVLAMTIIAGYGAASRATRLSVLEGLRVE